MSAVSTLQAAPQVLGVGPVGTRRHLHLVPTGQDVRVRRGSLRLTRRGRLAITLSAVITIAGLLVIAGSAFAATPAPADTVVVQSGQSLSDVAHQALPQLPVREAVARVQWANELNSMQVSAGQSLRIPR